MITKRISDGKRFYAGPVSAVKFKDEICYFRVMTPTRVGDANSIIIDQDDFEKDYIQTVQDPIVKHVRDYTRIPYACIIMTGDDEFYFSRCHKKDSYCKKTGRNQAYENGKMTYSEVKAKIKEQKGNGWEDEYDGHIQEVLTDLTRLKAYGDTYFASDYE